jgi:putative methylase
MLRKRHLEIILSSLKPNPSPIVSLEAYDLQAREASSILFLAEDRYGDISERSVLDLGCGAGVLAIGAALLGAVDVVGVDVNSQSIKAAVENAEDVGVDVNFIVGDIEAIRGPFDTTIMNPPFGTRVRGSDIKFLRKALEVSKFVYSIHKRGKGNRVFLCRRVKELGGEVDAMFEMDITIPKTYEFHRRKAYKVRVDLYRIISNAAMGKLEQ